MRRVLSIIGVLLALTLALSADSVPAEHFTAMAVLPPSARASSTVPLSINIRAYTDPSTLKQLGDILEDGQNEDALLKKFESMPDIGDVSREGRIGVQVKVIRVSQTVDGLREITMLTDRPIHFWEVLNGSPTVNYPFGMIRFTVNDKGDGTGEAYPMVKVKNMSANDITVDDYGVIPIQLTIHQIQ
jgi:hypothetical protein